MVIVRNPTAAPIVIEHGERIAQMVLARYEALPIEAGEVGVTTERVGGFGSTGSSRRRSTGPKKRARRGAKP